MNAQEAQLHYPLGDILPLPGRTLEVSPGIKWLRMRLPFALDHICRRRLNIEPPCRFNNEPGLNGWFFLFSCLDCAQGEGSAGRGP